MVTRNCAILRAPVYGIDPGGCMKIRVSASALQTDLTSSAEAWPSSTEYDFSVRHACAKCRTNTAALFFNGCERIVMQRLWWRRMRKARQQWVCSHPLSHTPPACIQWTSDRNRASKAQFRLNVSSCPSFDQNICVGHAPASWREDPSSRLGR